MHRALPITHAWGVLRDTAVERREVVGRTSELEAVRAFASGDGGAALVLEGEPGIGKTTLLREAVAGASGAGARILMAWPASAERALAFAGLGDLLGRALDDVLPELPAPQAKALEIALLAGQLGVDPVVGGHPPADDAAELAGPNRVLKIAEHVSALVACPAT